MKKKCEFSEDAQLYNDGEFGLMKHTKTLTIKHIRNCLRCQEQIRNIRFVEAILVEYFREEGK